MMTSFTRNHTGAPPPPPPSLPLPLLCSQELASTPGVAVVSRLQSSQYCRVLCTLRPTQHAVSVTTADKSVDGFAAPTLVIIDAKVYAPKVGGSLYKLNSVDP